MNFFKSICLIAICFSFVGCASSIREVTLKRAAFDLDCPADQLQIQELSSKSMGVKGCGKKAAYILHCDDWLNTQCTAILNSEKVND